jgi:protocatechuate 3,4-dioxygenase beta subunit
MTARNLAYDALVGAPKPFTSQASTKGKLEPTPSDIEGPFYKAGAPIGGDLAAPEVATLTIEGTVLDTDGCPITQEVILDVWHADPNGAYDEHGYKHRQRT